MSLRVKASRVRTQGAGRPGTMAGDPGIWGGIKGALSGAASGILGGNPIGGAFRGAVSGFAGRPSAVPTTTLALPSLGGRPPAPGTGMSAPRGASGLGSGNGFRSLGPAVEDITPAKACPQGYRPNKSAYYRRGPSGQVVYVPKGAKCVRIRRRDNFNPKALSRAVGRINGAKGIQGTLAGIETEKFTKAGRKK